MIGYNSTSFLPIRRIFWFMSSQVDSRPEFPASDVISVIERGGPVILSNVTIVGDLDISAMDLPIIHSEATLGKVARLISARIDIRNCEFAGAVNLSGAVFQESIDFSWSVFCQEVRFKGASFLRDARMEKAQFKRYATFRDARFTGEARFSGSQFREIANFGGAMLCGKSSFASATFSELCTHFGGASFHQNADFTESHFAGTANFSKCRFLSGSSFWQTAFESDASFEDVNFEGYTIFHGATFLGTADFRRSFLGDDANLESTVFDGYALFLEAIFAGSCNFQSAKFGKDVNLERSLFSGPAFFSDSRFTGQAVFSGSVFKEDASFNSAKFEGNVEFISVRFEQDARLLGTRFFGQSDLTAAHFEKNLILESARISSMRMVDAEFSKNSRISLLKSDFSRLEIGWTTIADLLLYDGTTYLSLVKNYRNLEWFEDADRCYYKYRRLSQSSKPLIQERQLNWSKVFDMVGWISCGYGVRPAYTVLLSILSIIVFATLFHAWNGVAIEPVDWAASAAFNSTRIVDPVLDPSWDWSHSLPFQDHVYFSTMTFLSRAPGKWYLVGPSRYAAMIEGILGWLLMALFLVTLGRKIIR